MLLGEKQSQQSQQPQQAEDTTEDDTMDECFSQASNCLHQEVVPKKPWTRDEIEDLHYMSFHQHTIKEMMYEFQRPRKSILKALRRIQMQQALFHPMEDVATAHNMKTEKLTKYLKDTLYYVPLPENQMPRFLIAATLLFGVVASYGYMFF